MKDHIANKDEGHGCADQNCPARDHENGSTMVQDQDTMSRRTFSEIQNFENLPDFNYDPFKISNQSGFHTIKLEEGSE